MDFLKELNEAQYRAVTNYKGPSMIVAGPGSGKTRVLTYRIAYMIQQGVDPFNILSLTFTNKAAKEMRHRIESICGNEARNLYMGTFHAVFARILRFKAEKLGFPSNFTIYDTDDAKSVIKKIITDYGLSDKTYKPNTIYNRISNAKNNLITANNYEKYPELLKEDEEAGRPRFAAIYKQYVKKCFENGAMDFDDLLIKFYELILRFPEELYTLQHRFKYILIDEFQDTNFAQYAIIKKLGDVHQNICVVGDDAQSIYAFRGATILNILNFQRDYPDLGTYKLEQNYRSTKNIVAAANSIISQNKDQLKKEIWTDNQEGDKIAVIRSVSDSEEGKFIAHDIFEIKNRHQLSNNDFAILYRTNAQSRPFEEQMRKLNIPYLIYGGLSFYQRKEVKDLLAYLKLILNPYEEESLRRIINYPARGIGDTSLNRAYLYGQEKGMKLWDVLNIIGQVDGLQNRAKETIGDFVVLMKSFMAMAKEKTAYDLAEHVAKSTGIIRELYNDKSVEGVSRYENIQELLNGIKEFTEDDVLEENEEAQADKGLGTYLQNITLLTDVNKNDEYVDTVKMMTIHAAKGLEFKYVYVVGAEEGLFPSTMSLYDREGLEEERRLFYVAITRAERKVTISYAQTRYKFGTLNGCEPSRFIDELPPENLQLIGKGDIAQGIDFDSEVRKTHAGWNKSAWEKTTQQPQRKPNPVNLENFTPDEYTKIKVGMRVLHQLFGVGSIISIEESGTNKLALVRFETEGDKKLMLKYAKLKILEVE
jgi:DNA helicase-2/ATP-dependent DNA helicase PcrA